MSETNTSICILLLPTLFAVVIKAFYFAFRAESHEIRGVQWESLIEDAIEERELELTGACQMLPACHVDLFCLS
jgi:hypothetical protein